MNVTDRAVVGLLLVIAGVIGVARGFPHASAVLGIGLGIFLPAAVRLWRRRSVTNVDQTPPDSRADNPRRSR